MNELVDLFTKKHGYYSKNLQFKAIVIIILIIIFFNIYFRNNYGFIIILLAFAFYISNIYVKLNESGVDDFNKNTMYRLNSLQTQLDSYFIKLQNRYSKTNIKGKGNKISSDVIKWRYELDALYIDAHMIHFLYEISNIYQYNEPEFYLLLKGTNNILRLLDQIETVYEENNQLPENTSEMFQSALQLKANTVNNLHNFIYTIPKSNKMSKYLKNITDTYNVLISRNLDKIYKLYKLNIKIRGIDNSTKFITYDDTKPYDIHDNHTMNPNDKNSKLISFYL